IAQASRFVFTTGASHAAPSLARLPEDARESLAVIGSGFGFPCPSRPLHGGDRTPGIAYLGTVDFVKMHPGFFEVIDRLDDHAVRVAIWGEPSDEVISRARAMRHPERVRFCGRTEQPALALSQAGIFFYPLQPEHY